MLFRVQSAKKDGQGLIRTIKIVICNAKKSYFKNKNRKINTVFCFDSHIIWWSTKIFYIHEVNNATATFFLISPLMHDVFCAQLTRNIYDVLKLTQNIITTTKTTNQSHVETLQQWRIRDYKQNPKNWSINTFSNTVPITAIPNEATPSISLLLKMMMSIFVITMRQYMETVQPKELLISCKIKKT